MKYALLLAALLTLSTTDTRAQNNKFKLMTWNVEWFGDANCNCDTSLQIQNVKTVLQVEEPDIIALQEVVNIGSMQKLANSLGYQFSVSPYASLASDTNSARYPSSQKLAYLYKPGIRIIQSYGLARTTYPLLSNSNSPYYYYASGRFPYLVSFELSDNTGKDTITLVNIHAKSGTSITDYNRRKKGASVMMDSLILQYTGKKVLVLGDFNDLLGGTILNSSSPSPYASGLTAGYTPWTHPDSLPGQTTYPAYSNSLIDNFLSSPEFGARVEIGSVSIRSNVTNYISNYISTTTDHYPVSIVYQSNVDNVTDIESKLNLEIQVYPNPAGGYIYVKSDVNGNWKYQLVDLSGKIFDAGSTTVDDSQINLDAVPEGVFILRLSRYKTVLSYTLLKEL